MTAVDPADASRHVVFTPTQQDLIAAYRRHAYGRLFSRATAISFVVSLLFVVGLARVILAKAPWTATAAVLAAATLGGVLAPLGMIRWQVPFFARRVYKQQRGLHEEIVLEWDASGLEAKAASGHSRTAWADFHRWREDEDIILLYHSEALFQLLPKRILSAAQIDDLRALAVGANVQGAKA